MESKTIIHWISKFASSPLFARLVKIGLVIAAVVHGYIISFGRSFHFRDIDIHREIGRRFLSGEYLHPANFPLPTIGFVHGGIDHLDHDGRDIDAGAIAFLGVLPSLRRIRDAVAAKLGPQVDVRSAQKSGP